ncbi:uncharacterized protein B0H18DRAFT_1033180 [Fomitopsis serialis]|uniref:uncharacterized protein n=1 Tax=Fomitopsis serialis TaxID=139415 RepID=UPI002008DCA0|nr:uncharacterized protein B0H18DRAFT_1033180 [Neoantrodia serialis]KAH9917821.1 hypothetical protein B0H18DRAFT_1033180 [Neoantrodia serialis]
MVRGGVHHGRMNRSRPRAAKTVTGLRYRVCNVCSDIGDVLHVYHSVVAEFVSQFVAMCAENCTHRVRRFRRATPVDKICSGGLVVEEDVRKSGVLVKPRGERERKERTAAVAWISCSDINALAYPPLYLPATTLYTTPCSPCSSFFRTLNFKFFLSTHSVRSSANVRDGGPCDEARERSRTGSSKDFYSMLTVPWTTGAAHAVTHKAINEEIKKKIKIKRREELKTNAILEEEDQPSSICSSSCALFMGRWKCDPPPVTVRSA